MSRRKMVGCRMSADVGWSDDEGLCAYKLLLHQNDNCKGPTFHGDRRLLCLTISDLRAVASAKPWGEDLKLSGPSRLAPGLSSHSVPRHL